MRNAEVQIENMEGQQVMSHLPYGFVRDFRLLVARENDGEVLLIAPDADHAKIAEVLRVCHSITAYRNVDNSEFEDIMTQQFSGRGLQDNLADDLQEQENDEEDLNAALAGVEQSADLLASDDDAPVIRLLNSLLSEAVRAGASDIHLEPYEDHLSVRLRVDGVLSELASLNPRFAPYLASRIKVMSRLDIAEKRLPQDGRMSLTQAGKNYDVRVSSLPVRFGERIVMRLLEADTAKISFDDLGMDPEIEHRFQRSLQEPNGIILVTGPTGSGKTTTLYAALSLLNDQTRNIMTVEDPVEYALNGISQTQVNTKVGMTFSGGLRSILRQDPDVVMVGEIRDLETAEMAVQASLTGHLVLSTVHTNSAIAAITRLADMGVERFLLASSVKAILAQRLVRKLCPSCKIPHPATDYEKRQLDMDPNLSATLYQAKGCDTCHNTGYKGRKGIYELVRIDDHLTQMILKGNSELEISNYAFSTCDTLSQHAAKLVLSGDTTIEEVMRVTTVREVSDASI